MTATRETCINPTCTNRTTRRQPPGRHAAGDPVCDACSYVEPYSAPHSSFDAPSISRVQRQQRDPPGSKARTDDLETDDRAKPSSNARTDEPAKPPSKTSTDGRETDGRETDEPAKAPSLITLDKVQPKRITWLWPGWIPAGMLSICDGLPGEGKSTMLGDIAARITRGDVMPGQSTRVEPGHVLFISYEDAAAEILRPRFDAAGGDVSRVHVHHPDAEDLFKLGKGSPLDSWIRETDARLVIIDPLLTAVPGGVDMHKGQDARRVLAPVARTAERTGAAVIGVRHFNKGEGRSALLRGEGSIGIGGTARNVFVVARDPDDDGRRVLARSKGNIGTPPKSWTFALVTSETNPDVARVSWLGESKHTADDLTGSRDDEPRGAVDAAADFLLAELADGPKPTTEITAIAKAQKHSDSAIKRARARLGIEATKTAEGWVLALPSSDDGGKPTAA